MIAVVAEQLHLEKAAINRSTRVIDYLKVNELDYVEMWMALQEQFGHIPDEEAERAQTVGELIDLISERVKSGLNK